MCAWVGAFGVFQPALAAAGDPWEPTVVAFCAGDAERAVELRRTVVLEIVRVGPTFQGALRTRGEPAEILREFHGESCEGVVGALRVAADLAEPPATSEAKTSENGAVPEASPPEAPREAPPPRAPRALVPFLGVGLAVGATQRPLTAATLSGEIGVGVLAGRKRAEVRLEGGGARMLGGSTADFRTYSGAVSALASFDATARITVGAGPFVAIDAVRAQARGESPAWAASGRAGGRTELRAWLMPRFAVAADFRLSGGFGRDRFFLYKSGEVARTPAFGWSIGLGVSWVFPKTEMAGGRPRHSPKNSL